MTFNVTVPLQSQSPGVFPTQNNTNFSRLQTLINAEHVFNDTAAANDGIHKQMTVIARTDPVSLPAGANAMFYGKTLGSATVPGFYDGISIFTLAAVRASVTFNGAGGVIQGTPFNITSVVKSSSSTFTITFTVPLPSLFSQFSIYSFTNPFTVPIIGTIISYTTSGSTLTSVTVRFVNTQNGQETAIGLGNIIYFGG